MKYNIVAEHGFDKTVGVFVLDGAVPMYAETLRYLAWALKARGARIVRFGCSGALEACTSINSIDRGEMAKIGKAAICARCILAQAAVPADAVDGNGTEASPLSEEAKAFLEEVRTLLWKVRSAEPLLDMTFAGFDIFRIAFFDFSIVNKVSHRHHLDDYHIGRLIAGVSDLLILLGSLNRFWDRHKITHCLFVNGNYSQNTLIRYFFAQHDVICLSVEPQMTSQSSLNRVFLARQRLVLEPDGLLPFANVSLHEGMNVRHARQVLSTFGARINGGDFNAYTSLGLDEKTSLELRELNTFSRMFARKHAFFLSSEDELIPHMVTHKALNGGDYQSPGGFQSQAEAVIHMLDEADKYPDIGFIVRLHPRMAANKRDKFESPEHIRYRDIFASMKIPRNVFIIYGDSKISSYYVVGLVDLVIVSWSTIGLEALLLGKPVVSLFPKCLMYPLAKFSAQPSSASELNKAIFASSHYGLPDDRLFLPWLTMAFESRFFTVAAGRNEGTRFGQFFRRWYGRMDRRGHYGIVAFLVGLLPSARVQSDDERLVVVSKRFLRLPRLRHALAQRALRAYRRQYLSLLAAYGNKG